MAKPIEDVLAWGNMTSVALATKSLTPTLPPSFMASGSPFKGNKGSYMKVEGSRRLAKACQYTAPAKLATQQGITETLVKLQHNREYITHDANTLIALRGEQGDTAQDRGRETVARTTAEFASRFQNSRWATVATALANGILYYDSDGNLLPSSSGAAYNIDFDIPAVNQDQLDGTLVADWSTASSNVLGDLDGVINYYKRIYGGTLKYALYGANIPGYMLNNTGLKSYVSGSPALSAQAIENTTGMPNYKGLIWLPLDAFWYGEDGDLDDATVDDTVVYCQEPSSEWWEVLQGSYLIPTTLGIEADGNAAMQSFDDVTGMFSYAEISTNPPGVNHYIGDTFLPVIKAPKSILQTTVLIV